MRSPIRTFLFLLLLAAIAYFAYQRFFAHHGAPQGGPGMAGGAPPVSVAEVIVRDVQHWQEFSGRLVAVDTAQVRPRVPGVIETIAFKEGARVEKGDLLFRIDPAPYATIVESAQSRAVLAEAELKRGKELVEDRALSQREYDQRENNARVARADLERATLDLGYTEVRAPIAGRVGRPEVTLGNLVDGGGGAPVLTTIVSDKPIYADFDIDEQSYLRYLKAAGNEMSKVQDIPVFLTLAGEDSTGHEGKVQSFDNQLNTASGTLRVRAVFPNEDGGLIPGLFAHVRLGNPEMERTVLITERAVGTDQNKKFVLAVGADGMVEYREVKLGPMVDGLRAVTSGLSEGDRIIVNGLQRARPGAPVTPETVPMDNPSAPPAAAPAPAPEASATAEPEKQAQ